MIKRSIRLKELGIDLAKIFSPSEKYLLNSPLLDHHEVYEVKTNGDGNQISIYQNNSNNEVFLLGDSTIEALYTKGSKKPHSILEEKLLENNFDYSVQNLGVSGTQLINIVNLLVNKLSNKSGSIVVITLPSNDLGPLKYKDGYFSGHKYGASILPAKDTKIKINSTLDLELYSRVLGLINEICKSLKLKLVFTSICYHGENSELKKLNEVARAFCEKHDVSFLDLEEQLKNSQDLFYDKVHFLSKGSEYFANQVFLKIKDFVIKKSNKSIQKLLFPIDNEILENQVVWSNEINVKNISKLVLTVNFMQLDDSSNPALFCVDYFTDPVNSDLIKSNNPEVGYYKYIRGVNNKKLEKSFHIYIPDNCTKIKVGLRRWRKDSLLVYYSYLTLIHTIDF